MKRFMGCTAVVLVGIAFSLTAHSALRKWNQKMQELGKTFSDILPLVSSQGTLKPAQIKKLEAATAKLAELSHSINMGPDSKSNPLPPESDPTLMYISSLFDRQVKSANRSLKAGQVEYARATLKRAAGYCIACHTRHDKGPEFPTFELDPKIKALNPIERAELLAATRQFDRAFEEFEGIVGDASFAAKRPFEWERAVRQALNLAVRVKRDPAKAEALVNKVLAVKTAPQYLRKDVASWKESIEMWKKEPESKAKTEEEFFQEAINLSASAKLKQQYAFDHAGDVLYLRASVLLHEQLIKFPNGKRSSEALLLAGNAYRLLGEPLVSPLPEMYYESCVRNSPHSSVAEQCFNRFEESVYFGFSGSGGTHIPDDMQKLLDELKVLSAEPQAKAN